MKRKLFSILTLALTLMLVLGVGTVSAEGEDDWPMFHHDIALTGYTTSDMPSTNATAWIYDTGSVIYSSPAIVNGKLYIGAIDGNVYALNTNSGSLAWAYNTGSPIRSSPAVSNGIVYILAEDGVLYAIDADTGVLDWNQFVGNGPWDWSSPAVNNDYVVVASSNGYVHRFEATTGTANWSTYIGGTPDSPISIANGKVYSGTHNFDNTSPTLVALDEETGAIIWTYDYSLYHGGVTGMVNSNGATVADSDEDGNLEVYFGVYNWGGSDNQTVCLDEATGTELWTADVEGNSTSTPAIHDGVVFIGSDSGKLYALDAETGTEKWSYQTGGQVWSAPAVADGMVVFGSLDHTLYALDEEDGSLIWSYYTGASRMLGSPAVAGGMVFTGNENGNVYAFYPVTATKVLESYKDADGDGLIEVGEDTTFVLTVTITNNDGEYPITDLTVKDRLGGDLEVVDPGSFTVSGPPGKNQKNKTGKVFLTWEIESLAPGESISTTIIVSTDINPGGHQEYTSAGIHCLNSGVNVKGTFLGSQISNTSDSIMVEVIEPVE
ncbi:MAG: PQQ-binding-like beta-propeller repeat protein [Dehalococcoidales bacterium]|nr:MAG: PQQ-binding-like beta-propeller repeat protein [Dehalococcoidales bacterium]